MYTLKNSVNEIINDPKLGDWLYVGISKMFVDMVPEEFRNDPLDTLGDKVKTRFGAYPADRLVHAANQMDEILNSGKYELVPLWKIAEGRDEPVSVATGDKDSVFLLATKEFENEPDAPGAIFCAGGAYHLVSILNEGFDTANKIHNYGYKGFGLFYRCTPQNSYPAPQLDMALAIKYLRLNAAKYHIKPDQILTMGFSAGAHLAGITACHPDEYAELLDQEVRAVNPAYADLLKPISAKADRVGLAYPVISFSVDSPWGTLDALAPGKENDQELKDHVSMELNVTPDYPKTFCWVGENDRLVRPYTGILFANALKKAGVEYEFKMYPNSGHGIALAEGTPAEVWMDELVEFFNK